MSILVVLAVGTVVYAGEIAELYEQGEHGDVAVHKSRPDGEGGTANHGISEIGLERTPCYGNCPVYSVIIKRDGTLRYKGEEVVTRKGTYTGSIKKWRFDRLARFVKDAGYMELKKSYSRPVTDHPTVYTTVVMNGKRKVVRDYADAGPARLWAIEELIDKLLSEAEWDEKVGEE